MSEGIIETDRWFGPLITNFQLTRTDIPVEFAPDFPLLQVQVLPLRVVFPLLLEEEEQHEEKGLQGRQHPAGQHAE